MIRKLTGTLYLATFKQGQQYRVCLEGFYKNVFNRKSVTGTLVRVLSHNEAMTDAEIRDLNFLDLTHNDLKYLKRYCKLPLDCIEIYRFIFRKNDGSLFSLPFKEDSLGVLHKCVHLSEIEEILDEDINR